MDYIIHQSIQPQCICCTTYTSNDEYICCDYCDHWYHPHCVGYKETHSKYKCPLCVSKETLMMEDDQTLIAEVPIKAIYRWDEDISGQPCWKKRVIDTKLQFVQNLKTGKHRMIARDYDTNQLKLDQFIYDYYRDTLQVKSNKSVLWIAMDSVLQKEYNKHERVSFAAKFYTEKDALDFQLYYRNTTGDQEEGQSVISESVISELSRLSDIKQAHHPMTEDERKLQQLFMDEYHANIDMEHNEDVYEEWKYASVIAMKESVRSYHTQAQLKRIESSIRDAVHDTTRWMDTIWCGEFKSSDDAFVLVNIERAMLKIYDAIDRWNGVNVDTNIICFNSYWKMASNYLHQWCGDYYFYPIIAYAQSYCHQICERFELNVEDLYLLECIRRLLTSDKEINHNNHSYHHAWVTDGIIHHSTQLQSLFESIGDRHHIEWNKYIRGNRIKDCCIEWIEIILRKIKMDLLIAMYQKEWKPQPQTLDVQMNEMVRLRSGHVGKVVWMQEMDDTECTHCDVHRMCVFGKTLFIGIILNEWDYYGHDGHYGCERWFKAPKGKGLIVPFMFLDCAPNEEMIPVMKLVNTMCPQTQHKLELLPIDEQREWFNAQVINKAENSIKTDAKSNDGDGIELGDRVRTQSGKFGYVKYIGEIAPNPQIMYGLELDSMIFPGNNGTFNGVKYLNAAEGRGYFTIKSDIVKVRDHNEHVLGENCVIVTNLSGVSGYQDLMHWLQTHKLTSVKTVDVYKRNGLIEGVVQFGDEVDFKYILSNLNGDKVGDRYVAVFDTKECRDAVTCLNCNTKGHLMKDCPRPIELSETESSMTGVGHHRNITIYEPIVKADAELAEDVSLALTVNEEEAMDNTNRLQPPQLQSISSSSSAVQSVRKLESVALSMTSTNGKDETYSNFVKRMTQEAIQMQTDEDISTQTSKSKLLNEDTEFKLYILNIPAQMTSLSDIMQQIELLSQTDIEHVHRTPFCCIVTYHSALEALKAKNNLQNAVCGGEILMVEEDIHCAHCEEEWYGNEAMVQCHHSNVSHCNAWLHAKCVQNNKKMFVCAQCHSSSSSHDVQSEEKAIASQVSHSVNDTERYLYCIDTDALYRLVDNEWKVRVKHTKLEFYQNKHNKKIRITARDPISFKLRLNHWIPPLTLCTLKMNAMQCWQWNTFDATVMKDEMEQNTHSFPRNSNDVQYIFCAKFKTETDANRFHETFIKIQKNNAIGDEQKMNSSPIKSKRISMDTTSHPYDKISMDVDQDEWDIYVAEDSVQLNTLQHNKVNLDELAQLKQYYAECLHNPQNIEFMIIPHDFKGNEAWNFGPVDTTDTSQLEEVIKNITQRISQLKLKESHMSKGLTTLPTENSLEVDADKRFDVISEDDHDTFSMQSHIIIPINGRITIQMHPIGYGLTIQTHSNTSITAIKSILSQKLGIDLHQTTRTVMNEDKDPLDDNYMISDYHIEHNLVLHITVPELKYGDDRMDFYGQDVLISKAWTITTVIGNIELIIELTELEQHTLCCVHDLKQKLLSVCNIAIPKQELYIENQMLTDTDRLVDLEARCHDIRLLYIADESDMPLFVTYNDTRVFLCLDKENDALSVIPVILNLPNEVILLTDNDIALDPTQTIQAYDNILNAESVIRVVDNTLINLRIYCMCIANECIQIQTRQAQNIRQLKNTILSHTHAHVKEESKYDDYPCGIELDDMQLFSYLEHKDLRQIADQLSSNMHGNMYRLIMNHAPQIYTNDMRRLCDEYFYDNKVLFCTIKMDRKVKILFPKYILPSRIKSFTISSFDAYLTSLYEFVSDVTKIEFNDIMLYSPHLQKHIEPEWSGERLIAQHYAQTQIVLYFMHIPGVRQRVKPPPKMVSIYLKINDPFYCKKYHNQKIPFMVNVHDSIAAFKQDIHDIFLLFGTLKLLKDSVLSMDDEDSKLLSDYDVQCDECIEVCIVYPNVFEISIQSMISNANGVKFTCNVTPNDTIQILKDKISAKAQQCATKMMFMGRKLEDMDQTMVQSCIRERSTIHVVFESQ
eukprot:573184_1